MPKKSHFTIFAIQNFVQNTKNLREFHLYCWDHVCKVNEWCLVDCFHRKFWAFTQKMIRDCCIAFRAVFRMIQNIYVNSNRASSIACILEVSYRIV